MKWFKPKNKAAGRAIGSRQRVEAVSDSLIWRDEAGSPTARCLVHRQRLVMRDPETGELVSIAEAHRVGEQTPFGPWRLHCIGSNSRDEHPVNLSESKSWEEAMRRASAKLDAVGVAALPRAR